MVARSGDNVNTDETSSAVLLVLKDCETRNKCGEHTL